MILLGGLLLGSDSLAVPAPVAAGPTARRFGRSSLFAHGRILRRLPEHMALGSSTLSYAARLLVTMVVATAIYRNMHLKNGYWVPMTALLVLKPQWTGTLSRSVARVGGTLSGAGDRVRPLAYSALPVLAHRGAGGGLCVWLLCAAVRELRLVFARHYAVHRVSVPVWWVFRDRGGAPAAAEYGDWRRAGAGD